MLPFQRSLAVDGDHHQTSSSSQLDSPGRQHLQRKPLPGNKQSPLSLNSNGIADIRVTSPSPSSASPLSKTSKKQASLARIAVPSFSAFKSQTSSVPRTLSQRSKKQQERPQPSPRHFSFAAEPSPRLVNRQSRPLSVHGTSSPKLVDNKLNGSSSHVFPSHDRDASIDSILSDFAEEERRDGAQESMNKLKPSMTLDVNGVQRSTSKDSLSTDDSKDRSKSPSRLGAFFGWATTTSPQKSSATDSPDTSRSDKSLSPDSSPKSPAKHNNTNITPTNHHPPRKMSKTPPTGLDISRANSDARFLGSPASPELAVPPEMTTHVQELERELSHISAELAGSIRREMDLEDEIDRLRQELPAEISRRGSDYFSDSGAGSVRYPITDPDGRIEEIEKSRRKAEQDKAQMKLDIAQKLQNELARRRELEEVVQNLEDQLERRSHEDSEKTDRKVEQLEAQLDDVKRKLNQEKEAKQNFEDLYTALQQELSNGRRFARGFSSIAEEDGSAARSGSHVRAGSRRAGSLTRSGSVNGRGRAESVSVPLTIENFKEIEDQRDALQKSLKLLITRHDKQHKDHERHIKKLTRNNQLALKMAGSRYQQSQYQQEVGALKEEVTTLRKRTEDALEQKWQYEKSLGGIKMDLDRAEQETRGLRHLLEEHDITAPSPSTMQNPGFRRGDTSPLTTSLASAQSDREHAHRLASEFTQRADAMQKSNSRSPQLGELRQAADRMEQLSQQFDKQVAVNLELRARLTIAVEKGEREQSNSTRQIEDMQKRLASMEDSLLAAQQHSENTLSTHETGVRAMEEATSPRLQRFDQRSGSVSPRSPGIMIRDKSGSTGLLRNKSNAKKSTEATLLEASRTQKLERQVRDLERLLRDAEDDMQHVVQRVNASQMEVAELTNERDAAFTQMRKLQDRLVEETERAESFIFRNLDEPQEDYNG